MAKDENPLRPTLPLPQWKVRDRKRQIITSSGLTKGVAIGGLAAGLLTFFVVSPWLAPFVLLGAFGGLGAYWQNKLKKMDPEIARQLVHESNHAQKMALLDRAQKLKQAGYESHAKVLQNFIQVKVDIEDEVHRAGDIDEPKQRIENLVDTLVADVAEQFDTLVQLDIQQKRLESSRSPNAPTRRDEIQATKEKLASQIERAYVALQDIGRNVPDILNPMPAIHSGVTSRLEETISDLHIEAEVAQNVGSRMLGLEDEL